jgi:hypothetical protein
MIATRRFLTKFRSAAAVMLAVLAVVFVPRLAHAQGSPQGAGPRPTAGHAKITYVQAGHLSMITKPQVVAAVIEQAARAS